MNQGPSSYALIVDDHPLSLKGLKHFLEELAVVGRVVAAEGLVGIDRALVEHGRPRLAMVDFWLADGPASGTLRYLQQNSPGTRLIVVSGDDRPVVADRARDLSAHGFIGKRESPRAHRNAVLAVLAGRLWFGDGRTPETPPPTTLPASPDDGGEALTPRQGEVLELLLQGRPNKLIAQLLSLSEYTVKEHVTSILRKLNATNRIELIMRLHAERRKKGRYEGAQGWSTTA